jgi:hypothetical protein
MADEEAEELCEVLFEAAEGRKKVRVVLRRDEYGKEYLRGVQAMPAE